jgi:hypothetical protein
MAEILIKRGFKVSAAGAFVGQPVQVLFNVSKVFEEFNIK